MEVPSPDIPPESLLVLDNAAAKWIFAAIKNLYRMRGAGGAVVNFTPSGPVISAPSAKGGGIPVQITAALTGSNYGYYTGFAGTSGQFSAMPAFSSAPTFNGQPCIVLCYPDWALGGWQFNGGEIMPACQIDTVASGTYAGQPIMLVNTYNYLVGCDTT